MSCHHSEDHPTLPTLLQQDVEKKLLGGHFMVSGNVDELFPNFGTPTTTMSTPVFGISPGPMSDHFCGLSAVDKCLNLPQNHEGGMTFRNELLHQGELKEPFSCGNQMVSDFDNILQAGTGVFETLLQANVLYSLPAIQVSDARDPQSLILPSTNVASTFADTMVANFHAQRDTVSVQTHSDKKHPANADEVYSLEDIKFDHMDELPKADLSFQKVLEPASVPLGFQLHGDMEALTPPRFLPSADRNPKYDDLETVIRSGPCERQQTGPSHIPRTEMNNNSQLVPRRGGPNQEHSTQPSSNFEVIVPANADQFHIGSSQVSRYATNPRLDLNLETNFTQNELPMQGVINQEASMVNTYLSRGTIGRKRAQPCSNLQKKAAQNTRESLNLDHILSGGVDSNMRRVDASSFENCGQQVHLNILGTRARQLEYEERDRPKTKPGLKTRITKSGTVQSSRSNSPSHFCHICTRADRAMAVALCGNFAKGKCRKVICAKCARDNGWTDALAAIADPKGSGEWSCVHCRGLCPFRAQCNTYGRINKLRRDKRVSDVVEQGRMPQQEQTAADMELYLGALSYHVNDAGGPALFHKE
jgi:hypothetical protein